MPKKRTREPSVMVVRDAGTPQARIEFRGASLRQLFRAFGVPWPSPRPKKRK